MRSRVLGLDIGGANLKAAHVDGTACTRPFALWRHPQNLAGELRGLIENMPAFDLLAVTMTAELCDCYCNKREGVNAVLDAVESYSRSDCIVWQNDGKFVSVSSARADPLGTASANWLALASYAGRHLPLGPALLIDVGSTTTDIIPIRDRVPEPKGRTDIDRLRTQELVYTGIARTPLCAVLPSAFLQGHRIRLAAEHFATTHDAYLLLGDLPEDPKDNNTADGRPATRAFAHARMARMLCADIETFTLDQAVELARQTREAQLGLLTDALLFVGSGMTVKPRVVLLVGAGEFLARQAVAEVEWSVECRSLSEILSADLSRAACAYAVAVLAAERG